VNRFPSDDHLASSFGIVPVVRDSADVKRRGRMSRDGPSIARWTLSIMVDTIKTIENAIVTSCRHQISNLGLMVRKAS